MVDSAKSMTGGMGGGAVQPGMDQSMVTAGPGSYNPNQEAFQPQAPGGGGLEQSEPINGGVAQVQPVQPIQTPNAPVPQDPQTDCKLSFNSGLRGTGAFSAGTNSDEDRPRTTCFVPRTADSTSEMASFL